MSIEQNKALMQRFLDSSIANDPVDLVGLLAADFVAHIPPGPSNPEGFVKHNSYFNEAFTDRQIIVEDLIAEGDKVIARIVWSGNQTGEFMGMPPSGKHVEISATITERIQGGKLVEHWSLFDRMAMMQQLGLIPGTQPAS